MSPKSDVNASLKTEAAYTTFRDTIKISNESCEKFATTVNLCQFLGNPEHNSRFRAIMERFSKIGHTRHTGHIGHIGIFGRMDKSSICTFWRMGKSDIGV